MKKLLSLFIVLAAIVTIIPVAQAGIVKGSALAVKDVVKGAAGTVVNAGKVTTFPLRHPKKTAHGVKKAAKAVSKL